MGAQGPGLRGEARGRPAPPPVQHSSTGPRPPLRGAVPLHQAPDTRWATRCPGLGWGLAKTTLLSRRVLDFGWVWGGPHRWRDTQDKAGVRPGARPVPCATGGGRAVCRPPGASCGQTGDSRDRVCEDPPPVSDPGPGGGGTLAGGRQGRAGPAQPNKGGPQSRPDHGSRAHPRTPEWAWLPHAPEMLTLAGAGGAAPEATASNGRDRPTTAQSSSLGGAPSSSRIGVLRPHSGLAASPTHSGEKRRGPEPTPCAGPPPGPSRSEPLDRRSSPRLQGSRWASPFLTRRVLLGALPHQNQNTLW